MPAQTIDEVIVRLDEIIADAQTRKSRLGYFPALYRKVTQAVKQGIADDFFEDGSRMERLDVVFANRYIEAYDSFQSGKPCTQSWQLAFDTTKRWWPIVLQHLVIGMNAHINLDLGIAAAEVQRGKNLEVLKNDFFKINEVLSSLVDEVQAELAKIWPLLKFIDWAAGRFDEGLADFSMNIARDGAWDVATAMSQFTTNNERQQYIAQLDARVLRFGQGLARPGLILSTGAGLIRLGEWRTTKKIIELLS